MSLFDFKFILFMVMVLTIYYICDKKWRWCVLLAASAIFFIAACSVNLFLVFALMSFLTWGAAYSLSYLSERNKKIITGTTIFILLLFLFFYKDFAFVFINLRLLESIFDFKTGLTAPHWLAPLGISYFTLILIGYLLDVCWGAVKAQKNPLKVLLFAGYFPQLTTGPFTRYTQMREGLYAGGNFNLSNVWNGLQRAIWGFFKVVVISTRLQVLVTTIYDTQLPAGGLQYTGCFTIIGAALYVTYVYVNFSGSMDVVIGLSEMFGITLPENFNRPFSSTSLSEFWRRWHITLGLWLKDFVLYPVLKSPALATVRNYCQKTFGKKVSKRVPTYIGMFVTWFCVGFWHGGSYKFIFSSGLFFFIMIVGGILLEPVFDSLIKIFRINTNCQSWIWFQRIRTASLFILSVSFGRASSLSTGFSMWDAAFANFNLRDITVWETWQNMGLATSDFWIIGFGLFLMVMVSHIQTITNGSVRKWLSEQNIVFHLSIIFMLGSCVIAIGSFSDKVDLMYGNF